MDIQAQQVGATFLYILQDWMTAEEWEEMQQANAEREAEASLAVCCASHDYLDANEAMLAAIRENDAPCILDIEDGTPEFEAACKIWNDAWEWAWKNGLCG